MFEKEITELFGLCRKAIRETNSFVNFETRRGTSCPSTSIYIIDDGAIEEKDEFDGTYHIFEREELRESSLEEYRKAKEHLTRLLKENGS